MPWGLGILGAYGLAYGVARVTILHRVEWYAGQEVLGVDAKANPRQDYITTVGQPPGSHWHYDVFRPLIWLEEQGLRASALVRAEFHRIGT
ncbi:MAG: hypothetical protein OHK0012_23330 [Synechococcales cyanobacterium]